jgi:transcriptional regulator
MNPPARNKMIDAGLDALLASRRPGQTFTQAEIAAATGLTRGGVHMAEKRAMRHLREAFRRELGLNYAEIVSGYSRCL